MTTHSQYPACFDPYLIYAIKREFRGFKVEPRQPGQPGPRYPLNLLVELKPSNIDSMDRAQDHGAATSAEPSGSEAWGYVTVQCEESFVTHEKYRKFWEDFVSRVELSVPVSPRELASDALELEAEQARFVCAKGDGKRLEGCLNAFKIKSNPKCWSGCTERPKAGALLIGVIDDGCPFANQRFLDSKGSTRVLALWDQDVPDEHDHAVRYEHQDGTTYVFGRPVCDFGYGLEYWRKDPDDPKASDIPTLRKQHQPTFAKPPFIGLDAWMQLHRTAYGSIDEDMCYADAGFDTLKHSVSHGSHVMDVLAGRIPADARLSGDRITPPPWGLSKGNDPAAKADIAFVQIPKGGKNDASGRWLDTHVLDGIRYILSCADAEKTKHVVINISYGPTTGPHDGTAVLELAMHALTQSYDGKNRKPKLDIVLSAGNSYLSEGHVEFDLNKNKEEEWIWRIPPDNTVPCFAEVWMNVSNDADIADVEIDLIDPSGKVRPPCTCFRRWEGSICWLLVVQPTVMGAQDRDKQNFNPDPHGNWRIRIKRKSDAWAQKSHAYVARSDPNMGARTGAKRSYFVDPDWERSFAARASHDRTEKDRDKSKIKRSGTLNGIGTGVGVKVAGGYRLIDKWWSNYSSSGPLRERAASVARNVDSGTLRTGPDYALPTDETYTLLGIRGAGNRSGGVFRLVGTSTAAPQLARLLANGVDLDRPKNMCPDNYPPTPRPARDTKKDGRKITVQSELFEVESNGLSLPTILRC
jgi:hypothetical protein